MDAPTITVAIPVKDRRERMLRCLDAVLALDYPRYDVLVLDNRSSDGTAEACRERTRDAQVPVRVEVIDGSVGRLRNRAATLTEAEVIAFTDSDCMPDRHWLAAGVEPLRRGTQVGVVQGKTLPEPEAEQRGWTATIEVTEWSGRFESCNLLVRREALAAADGFDEDVGHFWEDTAAGWSLLRAGWRGEFAPDAVVYHDVTHPGLAWFLRRAQRYGNVAAVVKRYPEVRRELLFARYFVQPRDARLAVALLGLALAPFERRALLLALPYAWYRRPGEPSAGAALDSARAALFDLAVLLGTARGAIRHRTLVL